MSRYLITYDEHVHYDYGALYKLMASWKAVHLANSVWLADLNGTAKAVRDVVVGTVHNADTVAVLELKQGSDWATRNVATAANAWLSAYISPSKKAA